MLSHGISVEGIFKRFLVPFGIGRLHSTFILPTLDIGRTFGRLWMLMDMAHSLVVPVKAQTAKVDTTRFH